MSGFDKTPTCTWPQLLTNSIIPLLWSSWWRNSRWLPLTYFLPAVFPAEAYWANPGGRKIWGGCLEEDAHHGSDSVSSDWMHLRFVSCPWHCRPISCNCKRLLHLSNLSALPRISPPPVLTCWHQMHFHWTCSGSHTCPGTSTVLLFSNLFL